METLTNHILFRLVVALSFAAAFANAETYYHQFVVQAKTVQRVCKIRNIITVNGQFPRPTLKVRNGDIVVIKVLNNARHNITLHWHGIRQLRTPWADGPEYVTQCPIQLGATYIYRYTIEDQEGTLWWYAQSRWLRATVYGALIIRPKLGSSYPFPKPKIEFPVILGECWNSNILDIMRQAVFTGGALNVSNAYTINGQPGNQYGCSGRDTTRLFINYGDTVLLRVVNVALNQQLFFIVANHQLTVVAADAIYSKPFVTRVILLGPGQTTDVLLTADQTPRRYYMAARAYASARNVPFNNTTTSAVLEYKSASCIKTRACSRPILLRLPAYNDTATVTAFSTQLKSPFKAEVPAKIDESLFFIVGLGFVNCNLGPRCQGPNNTRFAASINNISFVLPRRTSLLQAYYQKVPGIYTTDFPPVPPVKFDYTDNVNCAPWQPVFATKLYKLKFGSLVQIVLQDTAVFSTEYHPIHLHGYQIYVVGQGFGNFNPSRDTDNFNLIDQPQRNTIDVPVGGWAVIRFVANNPVWLFHCHIDTHVTWGLAMAFEVENGVGKS